MKGLDHLVLWYLVGPHETRWEIVEFAYPKMRNILPQ